MRQRFILIILILTAYSVFQTWSAAKYRRLAKSNNVIADANKASSSDISKALILYSYAYKINPTDENYSQLLDFYKLNTILYNDGEDKNDTINCFYSILKEPEKNDSTNNDIYSNLFNSDYSSTSELHYRRIGICLPEQSYFHVDPNGISVTDFNSGETFFYKLPISEAIDFMNAPNTSKIFIVTNNSDGLVWAFDLHTKKYEKLISYSEETNEVAYKGIKKSWFYNYEMSRLKVLVSENGRFLAFLNEETIPPNMNWPDWKNRSFEIFITDLEKETLTKTTIIDSNISKRISSGAMSNNGERLYLQWMSGGSGAYNSNVLYRLNPGQPIVNLYDGSNYTTSYSNTPSALIWGANNGYLFYGTQGGNLVTVKFPDHYLNETGKMKSADSLELLVSNSSNYISGISSLSVTDKYIFAGTQKGVIHIFSNGISWGESNALLRSGYPDISDIKLSSESAITAIYADEGNRSVYVQNSIGEIFRIEIKKYETLTRDENKIIEQLLSMGIDDLSPNEKKQLDIK